MGVSGSGLGIVDEFSGLGEEIWACLVRHGPSIRPAGRGTLLDVIEDLADEVGVGDVFDDAELATAKRAQRDVDVEDAFESAVLARKGGGNIDFAEMMRR